jgi:hypothetical protein
MPFPLVPQPKDQAVTRVKDRKRKKRDRDAEQREVYDAVNRRDRYRCRACGVSCDPGAVDMLRRGHHHHVTYRSKRGPTRTYNVCLLCPECHADVHAKRLFLSGNADDELQIERIR